MASTIISDKQNKINAGLRYFGSNVSGALALMVGLGAMSPEHASDIIKQMHIMYQATNEFIGAFSSIWYLVFPIISVWLAKMGINSSGFGVMMDKIFAAAKSGDEGAKVAIINAAASPAIGTTAIINKELAALPATPGNVVASTEALPTVTQ